MKAEAKTKQGSKDAAKTPERQPVRRVDAEPRRVAAAAPQPKDNGAGASMPDLTKFGISASDAQAHVARCEDCSRAHKHVMKNPKDAMALDSFGRRIGTCLAGKQAAHA